MIIDLGSGNTAKGLTKKKEKQGIQSKTIGYKSKEPDFSPLLDLTSSSKLCIVGHCKPGLNFIFADNYKPIKIEKIVSELEKVPNLKEETQNKPLIIDLIACNAGKDEVKVDLRAGIFEIKKRVLHIN